MKLTVQQQLQIRNHLLDVTIAADAFDELFDHVVTALEQKPDTNKFDLKAVKYMINSEFSDMINTPEEKKTYKRLNNIGGFVLFAIALLTYWLSMEPTVSFWDCGEFISAAYKIQVGHQPGAPFFLFIGKLFSLMAMGNTSKIAYWVNFSAVVASAATIMFLFWTITALAAKVYSKDKLKYKSLAIITAGVIGALAYTFSDTFWFSAVESEVYALASLFTAITFWAIMKWEEQADDRWLAFIALIVGISTGVHLLSLLTIPAVTLVYYFKKAKNVSVIGTVKAFLVGCGIVGVVQFLLIQYFVLFAAQFDLLFVNTFGFSFGTGSLFFILLFTFSLIYGIYYSIRHKKYNLNLALVCIGFLLFGFSSYFAVLIRADAKTDINLSNPDNPFSLYSYVGRNNYGSTPLLYGNTFDAKSLSNEETGNTYSKGKSKYEVSGQTFKTTFDKNMIFPRVYSQKAGHPEFYRDWLNMDEGESPSFSQNIQFFTSWQLGFMYWRYFLWNFAGRQNDIQGFGDIANGNWISGIKAFDGIRLGSQYNLPQSITANQGYNVYYSLPLIIGLLGFIWLYRRNKQYALIVFTLFFFTGIAIILYLNQDPLQVRERDYAYAGSFYAFAICIGFGVLAVKEFLAKIGTAKMSLVVASIICLAVPVLMGTQNWDDHNRSGKTTAADWAKNYLNSCAKDAILFTNADNDTYPLWYAQQIEGIRTDVRVICIQFLADTDYINQLKKQMNLSAPLPISMAEEKYVEGTRDYLPYVDYGITDSVELKDLMAVMTSENKDDQVQMSDGSFMNFLPTKKLKLTVDSEQLVKTHTITAAEKANVTPVMEWNFNKAYAGKGDLAIFDILSTNNWKRPIYFATNVSQDTYVGLDKYLYLEGYAFRLLPFKTAGDERDKRSKTHSDVMYANVMNKLDFKAFYKAKYADPETRRIINGSWEMNNTLAVNLITEGKLNQAGHIMDKSLKDLPLKNYAVSDTLNRIYTIQNLYALNKTSAANKLARDTTRFVVQELDYVATLDPQYQRSYMDNVRLGLSILNGIDKMTADYKQKELSQLINNDFNKLAKKFGMSI